MYSKSLSFTLLFLAPLFFETLQFVSAGPHMLASYSNPKITSPVSGTVWTIGTKQNVTWSTANAPANITNRRGRIILARNQVRFTNAPGGFGDPLAENFDILLGRMEITVPDVTPANDYEIVLFGNSGNIGQDFTISN